MSKKGQTNPPIKNQKNIRSTANGRGAVAVKPNAQKIVFIIVAALLAAVIITSSLIFFIPLIRDSREKNFSYLSSDLSYYLDIPEDVYKDITLSIDIARPKESEVESAILYFLAMERSKTPLYDGAYQKDVVIDVGDTISFWYRAYTIEDGKEIDYATNFAQDNPATLIVGEGKIFAHGLEAAIVSAQKTPNETPAFVKITEGAVLTSDVVYVSYTELLEGDDEKNAKKYANVRIDLGDSSVAATYGEDFISAIKSATIGGAEKTAQAERDGKTYNYTKLKVDYVTRCEGSAYTLTGYFPYDYTTAALRNKTIYFDLYIQGVVSYETPAFDDAFVKNLLSKEGALITLDELASYPGGDLAEKYRAYYAEYLNDLYEANRDTLLEKALWKHYTENITIKNYPTKKVDSVYREYYDDVQENYERSGGVITDSMTGESVACTSLDQYAKIYLSVNYTGEDWRAKIRTMAESLVKERLILYYIMRRENFIPDDDTLSAKVEETKQKYLDEYMKQFLEEIHKDRDDYTDDEYAELVAERSEVLFDYFDNEYFKENAYYEIGMEKFKEFVTVKTFDSEED